MVNTKSTPANFDWALSADRQQIKRLEGEILILLSRYASLASELNRLYVILHALED